jgi:hypothetical protein
MLLAKIIGWATNTHQQISYPQMRSKCVLNHLSNIYSITIMYFGLSHHSSFLTRIFCYIVWTHRVHERQFFISSLRFIKCRHYINYHLCKELECPSIIYSCEVAWVHYGYFAQLSMVYDKLIIGSIPFDA